MNLERSCPVTGRDTVAVRLLRAACEAVGDEEHLASRLNMSRVLLSRYMAGHGELPQHLLMRVVDLLLQERETRTPLSGEATASGSESRDASDLPA